MNAEQEAAARRFDTVLQFAELHISEPDADAEHLLAWIVRTQSRTFSRRDANRATRHKIDTLERLGTAMDVLTQRGYIRRQLDAEKAESPAGGRPASPSYEVRPEVLSVLSPFPGYSENARETNTEKERKKGLKNVIQGESAVFDETPGNGDRTDRTTESDESAAVLSQEARFCPPKQASRRKNEPSPVVTELTETDRTTEPPEPPATNATPSADLWRELVPAEDLEEGEL